MDSNFPVYFTWIQVSEIDISDQLRYYHIFERSLYRIQGYRITYFQSINMYIHTYMYALAYRVCYWY